MDEVTGGASENVIVVPATEYVFFCWYTPFIKILVVFSFAGALARTKVVSVPSPVKLAIIGAVLKLPPILSYVAIVTFAEVARTNL
jgi:hypothetical protein